MSEEAAGQPRKVWVLTFSSGGVAQYPQVYETENGARAALDEYARACSARWDDKAEDWDFSETDDDARVDEVPVREGFLIR
jgi:hypothetical protein